MNDKVARWLFVLAVGFLPTTAQGGPPNCAATSVTVLSTTPVPIADLATSSSTLTVSGASPFLYLATVNATITHSFAADLDLTLISPGGTRVTLSTDNGAGNDDVFAGTTWSDAATVPTTDAVYANGVVQPLLVPEEAMGALYGENPNGTWRLEIVDDKAGDSGVLVDWSLQLEVLASVPIESTATFANTTPVDLPDVATRTSTITVSGLDGFLCRATLETSITQTFAANLDITLFSPTSSTTITTDNGAGNDDVFDGSLWSDSAGIPASDFVYANLVAATPLVPEGAFGHFLSSDPNGPWTLSIFNDLAGDAGTLNGWTLNLTTCACLVAEADLALTKSVTPAAVAPGGQVVFTLTATNNGPGTANNVQVIDSLPVGMEYVSNDCGAGFASPALTWNIASLADGASQICRLTVTVEATGTNDASIRSDQNDPVPTNNAAAAIAAVQPNPLEIPTASAVGLLVLGLGLGLAALAVLRRRSG